MSGSQENGISWIKTHFSTNNINLKLARKLKLFENTSALCTTLSRLCEYDDDAASMGITSAETPFHEINKVYLNCKTESDNRVFLRFRDLRIESRSSDYRHRI